jgi:hypothetical protein
MQQHKSSTPAQQTPLLLCPAVLDVPPFPIEGTCVLDCDTSHSEIPSVGNASSEDRRPELNFSGMPGAILVEKGGFLLFNNVRIAELASTTDYQYSDSQPYVNQGVGYGLFPTIGVAPGGTVSAD